MHSLLAAYGQTTIRGTVLDETRKPIIGATIFLNGSKGTVADMDGSFSFTDVRAKNFCVEVSALGFSKASRCGKTDTLASALVFVLVPSVENLDEVTVNGSVEEELKRTESLSIQHVQEEFLDEAKGASLMQSLDAIPGVNSMDIGTGISKPMIRGMSSYRVVVAENGIKQEGQQWSSHHGISIDQGAVDHVEIIKGPASLQYGSDAIGGVINALPEPVPVEPGLSGEISLSAKSNTNWLGSAGELAFRKGDFFTNASFTFNSFDDFRIPETESFLLPAPVSAAEASHQVRLGNQLYNTAGEERGLSVSTGIVKKWGKSYFDVSYYGTTTGFFDWQGIQNDSIRAIHSNSRRDLQLPYQQVSNYSIKHFTTRYFKNDKLEVGLGYQNNNSKEFANLSDRTGNRTEDLSHYQGIGNLNLGLYLQTFSGNVFYTLKRIERHAFKFGLNTQHQIHQRDGYNHILPNYTRSSSGLFLTHKYTINKKWLLSSGARIDYTLFHVEEAISPDPALGDSIFNPEFSKTFPGTSFSLGLNYVPNRNTIVKINIGKSFRVPAVYELAAYGLHRHEARFEKGNIDNNPEQAWQLDLGIERKWKVFAFKLSPFLTYFSNYLYLNPSPELRQTGQVYEYRQSRAMLAGGELSARYRMGESIELGVDGEYVYAVNLDLNSALPFTPPLNVRSTASYSFKSLKTFKKNKMGVELVSVARQNFTVPNELSTPGYNSVNVFVRSEFALGKQKFNLMFKVRNLLNASYYNHISFYRRMRIPEAGRDFQLFLTVPFNDHK